MTDEHGAQDELPAYAYALWHNYSATVNGYEQVEFPRLLGVYSSQSRAEDALTRSAKLPGFNGELRNVDDVDGLVIDRIEIDYASWGGGFFSHNSEGAEE
jgi:hypothetical protein